MTLQSTHPWVSLIVPTRNRPALLCEAVESALAQSYERIEIVVVSDGCAPPHNLPATLPEGRRLQLITLPTQSGPGAARNAGLAAAQGELVSYLDDDDLLHPEHLEGLVTALLARTDSELAYADAEQVVCEMADEKLALRARRDLPRCEFDYDALSVANFIPLICVAHTKSLLATCGPFRTDLPCLEDWELLLRLCRHTTPAHVHRTTATYRVVEGAAHVNTLRAEGIQALARIYELHPTRPELETSRAHQLADLATRLRLTNRQRAPIDVSAMLAAAQQSIGDGALQSAVSKLEEILSHIPNDGELLHLLSRLHRKAAQPERATELERAAKQHDPYFFT